MDKIMDAGPGEEMPMMFQTTSGMTPQHLKMMLPTLHNTQNEIKITYKGLSLSLKLVMR